MRQAAGSRISAARINIRSRFELLELLATRDQMEDAELMAVLRPTGGAADRLQFAPSSGAVRTGDQMPTEGQELRLQVEDAEGKGGAYRRGRQGEAP
jgi:hypothetical protein